MKSLYAIDIGIGFTKRTYRQDVDSEMTIKSEASTLAPVPNHAESEDLTKVSFIDLDFAYYMGNFFFKRLSVENLKICMRNKPYRVPFFELGRFIKSLIQSLRTDEYFC